jgi:hypothetical protein
VRGTVFHIPLVYPSRRWQVQATVHSAPGRIDLAHVAIAPYADSDVPVEIPFEFVRYGDEPTDEEIGLLHSYLFLNRGNREPWAGTPICHLNDDDEATIARSLAQAQGRLFTELEAVALMSYLERTFGPGFSRVWMEERASMPEWGGFGDPLPACGVIWEVDKRPDYPLATNTYAVVAPEVGIQDTYIAAINSGDERQGKVLRQAYPWLVEFERAQGSSG